MRIYRKEIEGIKVTAYNDSDCEWVVQAGDMLEQRFPINAWTMKDAMDLAARIANG
jgi:GH24 family phage-related lysozyme (muramidase)